MAVDAAHDNTNALRQKVGCCKLPQSRINCRFATNMLMENEKMLFDTRYLTTCEAEELREQALCRLREDLQAERSRSLVAIQEGRKTPQEDIGGRWRVSVPSAKP